MLYHIGLLPKSVDCDVLLLNCKVALYASIESFFLKREENRFVHHEGQKVLAFGVRKYKQGCSLEQNTWGSWGGGGGGGG